MNKHSEAQAKWDEKYTERVSLKFHKINDFEILKWLHGKPSKTQAIRDAILYYIQSNEGEEY